MGIGLTPTQLAAELKVTPSRVSQMFKALVQRTALHFGQDPKRAHRPPAANARPTISTAAWRSANWSWPPVPTKAPGAT